MSAGQVYYGEQIKFFDSKTKTEIIQLTSFPCISMALSYYQNFFTLDSRTLIFLSQREAFRDAPYDLFRVDVDGWNLTQLTELERVRGAVLSHKGNKVYFTRDNILFSVDMETFKIEEISYLNNVKETVSNGVLSHDEKYYFVTMRTPNGEKVLTRFCIDGAESMIIRKDENVNLHSCDPDGRALLVYVESKTGDEFRFLNYEGELILSSVPNRFAHSTWLGKTGRIQGCGYFPNRALSAIGIGEKEPTTIASGGPYFWHSASTLDGKWIIADTNWPDEGLQLICVPTGKYKTLCYPGSSEGHPQWTHPHPAFSPDGHIVIFNSDRTGIPQIYAVTIPENLREELKIR